MPEKHNALEKIQGFLKGLEPLEQQDAWAILSCIRGPDDKSNWEAKELGTIAIRAALYPPMFNLAGQYGNEPNYIRIPKRYQDETVDDYYNRIYGKLYRRGRVSVHYADHIAEAMRVIRSIIDNPTPKEENASGGNSKTE